jgi:hypothetical protein
MRADPAIVWEMYLSLEKDFLNYLEYVPLTSQHFEVWSYPLVNLFNNIGSSVDSFFKNAIFCDSLNEYSGIDQLRNRSGHNMKTYRAIFETQYKISNTQIFELKNFSSIYPFKDWSDERTPDWWSRYTAIKHDRFRNKKRATLKTTIDALAGLLTLFLTHKETLSTLIDYNVMHSQIKKDVYKPILLQGAPFEDLGVHRIYVKTGLFGYVFGNMNFPIEDSDKIRMLSPAYPGYG